MDVPQLPFDLRLDAIGAGEEGRKIAAAYQAIAAIRAVTPTECNYEISLSLTERRFRDYWNHENRSPATSFGFKGLRNQNQNCDNGTYMCLLDADAEGADWREVAWIGF